ncbi:MAG: hypothetical protein ACREV8_04685, partial [Gammaproteobacteria bacterium]
MNRISLGLAILIALAFAGPAAQAERVMSGAMDICKAVDGGEVTINGDVESCCAQERVEYDDGFEIDGPVY